RVIGTQEGPGAIQGSGVAGDPGAQASGGVDVTGPGGVANTRKGNEGLTCAAGKNGGATDTGVTATEIKLATNLAESGTASAFLGDARYGMQAVIDATNRSGGVCGRQLKLNPVDDEFKADRGEQNIKTFIQEGYFALPVMPSSEGLNAASQNGVISRAGIPVIGSDGMLFSQYDDPWIWPVATSTISTAHIAAKNGYENAGARTFGIVWDKTYKFGTEGDNAFKKAVERLGGQLVADISIGAGQQDYSADAASFVGKCHPCDMTFMMLEPDTAISWIRSDPSNDKHYLFGSKRTAGPQPLFVSNFGQSCGQLCNGMWVWTGFKAPYAPFDSDPAVRQYKAAVESVGSHVDTGNQFLEGAYVGMQLFVEALKRTGPNLTRARLKETMDSMSYDSGLTEKLTWSAGNHFANTSMLGFTIQFSQGFGGFQYQQTDWVKDPWYNQDRP
ncbi:MAG: hypothetical protein QOE92_1360, partial [Chloroflexota bacterium]|nr:hypothetical protein [Chloroflexota bacterium]